MDLVDYLRSAEFLPHAHCYLEAQGLAWANFVSNWAITGAYVVGIPLALLRYSRHLGLFGWTSFWVLVAFIISCGLGHSIGGSNLYLGQYRVETVWNIVTAAVSWTFVASLAIEVRPMMMRVARALMAVRKLIEMADELPAQAVEYVRQVGDALGVEGDRE